MATPTPGRPGAGAVATPPVSTPFSSSHHPAFSPHGPRSVVPSPQQVKKSPATSQTMYGYTGSTPGASGLGGGHFGAGAAMGYDSPSAAMALGGMGMELGIDGLGGDIHGLGAVGGIGGGAERRDEDIERRRKLEQVKDILKVSKGRLSESGIERLAQRAGLECLWESNAGTRTLIIAGSALALDIDFRENVVKKVSLSFPESPEIVTRWTEKAGAVLGEDLKFGEGENGLTKGLDMFAGNLERLAALDRLSVVPGLNCHEAVAGMYECLEKISKWEVERLKAEGVKDAEREALCSWSGKPGMHERDRLGLSLDYWQEKRRLAAKKDVKTWSILVDCAPISGMLHAPLRVSENWISADIKKKDPSAEEILLAPEGGLVLDWLEPENILLPSAEPPKADPLEGFDQPSGQKYPEVMFVAKFHPPLTVPYTLAAQIYNSTSTPLDLYQTTTFDGLLFPPSADEKSALESRTITRTTTVATYSKNGEKKDVQHKNKLWVEKVDYGRTLTELPFSHPKQLVEMLPHLRQYAFLNTVLLNTLKSTNSSSLTKVNENPKPTAKTVHSKYDDFDSFMSQSPPSPPTSSEISLDIQLFTPTQSPPRLRVVFPFSRAFGTGRKEGTANVTFEIGLNGNVVVVEQNLIPVVITLDEDEVMGNVEDETEKARLKIKDLGKMLEICEDLGVWVEFVRGRLG